MEKDKDNLEAKKKYKHLIPYGYTPWWYTMKCKECWERTWDNKKKSWRCIKCATKEYEKDKMKAKTKEVNKSNKAKVWEYVIDRKGICYLVVDENYLRKTPKWLIYWYWGIAVDDLYIYWDNKHKSINYEDVILILNKK